MKVKKGELLEKRSQLKFTYYYYFEDAKKPKRLSQEIFRKSDIIVHYPRSIDGDNKYKTIEKFTYKGFKGKLPVGVIKSVSFGYGFTKTLNPFAFYLNDNYDLKEVIIEKAGKIELNNVEKKLYLNEIALQKLNDTFRSIYKKNKKEIEFVLKSNLHNLFPNDISKPANTYVANALAHSLSSWGNSIEEFSEEDKKAIIDLFDKLSLNTDFLSNEALAKTKEIVDHKYIQETLKKYKELMGIKSHSDNLESKWQKFLNEHNWIFSYIFAQPVILHKREAYVGGKNMNNENGKFTDFLIKNSLSDNVSFLELKTHKTKLIETKEYRGEDVFSVTKDLSGSINQVLNQRDNFQKEFYAFKYRSKENIETLNSKCVVLIGMIKELNDKQKYSFELFRSNSRDVEILTFDELQSKIESLQELLKSS